MSTNPRYDFQRKLNEKETELMEDKTINPWRIGVTIQIKGERQDEHAPTRGGNPYLGQSEHEHEKPKMNCFCRLVISDRARLDRCNKLEEILKNRLERPDNTNDGFCCRCHMGVSNFVKKHHKRFKVENEGSKGPAKECVEKQTWYIFVGQVLVKQTGTAERPKEIAGATVIEHPRADERPYIRPFHFINDREHFTSPEAYSALCPTPNGRLAELYGKWPFPVGSTDSPEIGHVDATTVTNYIQTVTDKFDEWLDEQVEIDGFSESLKLFVDSKTVHHAIDKLQGVITYLHRWTSLAPVAQSPEDLGRLRDRIEALWRILESCRANKITPLDDTLRLIHGYLDKFANPKVSLVQWHSELKALLTKLHDDLKAAPVEDEQRIAHQGNIHELASMIDGKQFYPTGLGRIMKCWRFMSQHPATFSIGSAGLWAVFTGGLINLLTDTSGTNASPWLWLALATSVIGAATAEVLKRGLEEFEPSADVTYYKDRDSRQERDLRKSFAADLFLHTLNSPIHGKWKFARMWLRKGRFWLFVAPAIISILVIAGIFTSRYMRGPDTDSDQQTSASASSSPVPHPANVNPLINSVGSGNAPTPKELKDANASTPTQPAR